MQQSGQQGQRGQQGRLQGDAQRLAEEQRRKQAEASNKRMAAAKKAKEERAKLRREKLNKARKERLAKYAAKKKAADAKRAAAKKKTGIRYADKSEVKKDINKFKANLAKGLTATGKKISPERRKAMAALDAKLAKQKENSAKRMKAASTQDLKKKLTMKRMPPAYIARVKAELKRRGVS
jgi:hypothetical protein